MQGKAIESIINDNQGDWSTHMKHFKGMQVVLKIGMIAISEYKMIAQGNFARIWSPFWACQMLAGDVGETPRIGKRREPFTKSAAAQLRR